MGKFVKIKQKIYGFFSPFISWFRIVKRGYASSNCGMHAAGLTYFSLLAIVPVLCVLLFTARMFQAERYVRAQIDEQIEIAIVNIEKGQDDQFAAAVTLDEEQLTARKQLAQEFGRQARNLSNQLFSKIENFDVNTLGWIGFLFLIWTAVNSIGMVEVSFNEVWSVPKPRPIWKRASLCLIILIVLPILVALAMSVPILNSVKQFVVATLGSTYLTQWASYGVIWLLDSCVIRFIFTLIFSSLSFAFLFYIVPNCHVLFSAAIRGGVLTAILFALLMKICAIAQLGIANSSALYGTFALLPILLAWLYMSWQILLLGSCFTRAFHLALKGQK